MRERERARRDMAERPRRAAVERITRVYVKGFDGIKDRDGFA